jgi:hypothetical protein
VGASVTAEYRHEQLLWDVPTVLSPELIERFWRYIDKGDGCWEWIGRFGGSASQGERYGVLREPGRDPRREYGAHRLSFEIHFGPIPADLFVLHRCDNRSCVRPDHLFLGTQLDNIRDMVAKGRQSQPGPKSHCARGHALTDDNLVFKAGRGRQCRACLALTARARRHPTDPASRRGSDNDAPFDLGEAGAVRDLGELPEQSRAPGALPAGAG